MSDPFAALDAAMSEAELQASVIQAARLLGWRIYHTYDSRRSQPGFPDLVLVHPNRDWPVLVVELKSMRGTLSSAQAWWLEALDGRAITTQQWTPALWRTGVIEEHLRDPSRSTPTTLVALPREALIEALLAAVLAIERLEGENAQLRSIKGGYSVCATCGTGGYGYAEHCWICCAREVAELKRDVEALIEQRDASEEGGLMHDDQPRGPPGIGAVFGARPIGIGDAPMRVMRRSR